MSQPLSDIQSTLLKGLMDIIIPDSEHMPSASSVATQYVEKQLEKRPQFDNMLELINKTEQSARSKYGRLFSELADNEKETLLKTIEIEDQNMFQEFVNLVYNGYYTNPKVVELLGPDAGIPQPKGFSNPPFNPNIVDRVRTLGPKYRSI